MKLTERGTSIVHRSTRGTRNSRRAAAAVTVGVVAAMTMTACSSGGSSSSAGASSGAGAASGKAAAGGGIPATTLNVIAADYGNGPGASNYGGKWWDTLVKNFNKKYPQITVKVNVVNWTDVDKQIISQVQAGNPPDIAQASADWTGLQQQVYPAKDVLSPSTMSNLIPSFAKQGDIGGTEYGIPWIASSRALIYNKTLFKKAGISAPPKTWAQYKTDAQKLKAAGVQIPACIPLGSEEAQAETLIWELGNGGGFVNSAGKWALNSQADVETFKYLNSLEKANLIEPSPGTVDRTKGCWTDFDAGHVGMTNSMTAQLPMLAKTNIKYAFAPTVGKNGPAPTTLGVNDWIWAFKTKTDHQKADRAFLDFAISDANQMRFFNEYKLLPITKGASAKAVASTPVIKPFVDALPKATFYPVGKKTWPQVNQQMKQIVGQAVSNDPKSVLDQLQQTAGAS